MEQRPGSPNQDDRRHEPRRAPTRYYSVQFTVEGLASIYQFKIRDLSENGMCILVSNESDVLNHLHVGDVLKMQYYISDSMGATEEFRTEIRHILRDAEGRYKGHTLVGLSIL